jgi:hypothetical protein
MFRMLGAAIVLWLCFHGAALAGPIGPFGPERIDQIFFANNGFFGVADYFIEFSNNQVTVHSEIQFTVTEGVTEFQFNSRKRAWERVIESVWSEQFDIIRNATERFPIFVDVTYDGPVFNHNVTVRPGPARSNEFLWDTQDSGFL